MAAPTRVQVDGFDGVQLSDEASPWTATFVPSAGMIGVSLSEGETQLLGQRHGVERYADDGKTMGIPLLHPWANRLGGDEYVVAGETVAFGADAPFVRRDANGLPIHGLLAGNPDWRARQTPTEGWDFSADFDFGADARLLKAFPFPHALRIDVALRERKLTLSTTLTATGDRAVPIAFGFHPYLQLPAPREHWLVELPSMRHLTVDERGIPTGQSTQFAPLSEPLGATTYDDGFADVAAGALFAVSAGERRVTVCFEQGYPFAQVYAPASEEVICFEPMTAPTNALLSGDGLSFAAPGESRTAIFAVEVANT